MYDGFDGLENQIEDQEKEAAELNRREEWAEARTEKLESAVSRLEDDARVCTLLNEKREQAEEERARASEEKREFADRLLDVENQLRELAEETDNEAAVIAELREMGEEVSASEAVIQQKKDWIMACQQKTEMIAEILGLNIGSLDLEASEGEGVSWEKENKELENASEGKESSDSRRAKFLADLKYDPPLHKNGTEDSGTDSDSDDVDRGQRDLERAKDTAGRQKGRDDEERMDMTAVSGKADRTENVPGTRIRSFLQGCSLKNLDSISSKDYNFDELFPVKGERIFNPTVDIKALDKTEQIIETRIYADGRRTEVFDHPDVMARRLPWFQGANFRNIRGTCGLADTGVWLSIAGSRYKEKDVVEFARSHCNKTGKRLCGKEGGTVAEQRKVIWEHFGMPADIYRKAQHSEKEMIERIGQAVESGRAVAAGLNAGKLWERDNPERMALITSSSNAYGDGGSNHVVGIISCERDAETGNITHFYINDTGRSLKRDACRKVSVEDFKAAFFVPRASACISKRPVW